MKVSWIVFVLLLNTVALAQTGLRFEKADDVEEGDGASVRRLMPKKGIKHYDPYVLFDHFTISPTSGFPDHFHSGFEVITYVTQGKLQHKDSKGNTEVLSAGDVQCFTTGSGVVHSEMPQGTEEVKGFQIWINLPKEFKTIEPAYQLVKAEQVPQISFSDEVKTKVIASANTLVRTKAQLLIKEITMTKGSRYKVSAPTGYHGFVYVSSGSAVIENKALTSGGAVFFTSQDLEVQASEEAVLMLVTGLPIGEPIKRRGSIVK